MHIDLGGSEQGTVISVILCVLGTIIGTVVPVLQDIAYICTITVACGTIFLNFDKYSERFKKTSIYKYFKSK